VRKNAPIGNYKIEELLLVRHRRQERLLERPGEEK